MKMKKVFAVAMFSILLMFGIVGCSSSGSSESSETSASGSSEAPSSEVSEAESVEELDSKASSSGNEGVADSQASASSDDSQPALQNAFEEKVGQILFTDQVRNDKTGNWRCCVYYSSDEPQDIAADYYKAYFTDDSEIHALINLGLKTSANISAADGLLFVDVYEYVDGEEHDAEKMFTGNLLAKYLVYLDSGNVEKL